MHVVRSVKNLRYTRLRMMRAQYGRRLIVIVQAGNCNHTTTILKSSYNNTLFIHQSCIKPVTKSYTIVLLQVHYNLEKINFKVKICNSTT